MFMNESMYDSIGLRLGEPAPPEPLPRTYTVVGIQSQYQIHVALRRAASTHTMRPGAR